jgi:hypothetical protein
MKSKFKNHIKEYNKGVKMMKGAMNKMMMGGSTKQQYKKGGVYSDIAKYKGSHVNNMAPMYGFNQGKVTNMHSPLHAVNPEVLGVLMSGGYNNYSYGGNTMQMGGTAYNETLPQGYTLSNSAGMEYSLPMFQMGGQAPMMDSNQVANQMMAQEGMAPMDQGMMGGDEQKMDQLYQLAQAAFEGDEEAIQLIEQLSEEDQQIVLQMLQDMEGEAPEPTMAQAKRGGSTKKKKKMKKGGYAKSTSKMKMNKLYNTLGIPC